MVTTSRPISAFGTLWVRYCERSVSTAPLWFRRFGAGKSDRLSSRIGHEQCRGRRESSIFLLNQQNCHSQQRGFGTSAKVVVYSPKPKWLCFPLLLFPLSEIITASRPRHRMPAGRKMHRSNRYTIIVPNFIHSRCQKLVLTICKHGCGQTVVWNAGQNKRQQAVYGQLPS